MEFASILGKGFALIMWRYGTAVWQISLQEYLSGQSVQSFKWLFQSILLTEVKARINFSFHSQH